MGRVGATSILLLGASLCCPYASPAAEPTGSPHDPGYSSAQIRVISICPGVVIHGLGHLAAGDPSTAQWLFLAETAGYAAMFTAGNSGRPGLDRSRPRAIAFGAGLALFVGSWVYDVLRAPSARREPDGVSLNLRLEGSGDERSAVRVDLTARLDI